MAIHKFKLDYRVASYCMSRGVHAEPLQSLKRGIYYLTMYMVNTAFLMVTPMILTIFQLVVSKYFELKISGGARCNFKEGPILPYEDQFCTQMLEQIITNHKFAAN